MSISAAKSRVTQAKDYLSSNRLDLVEQAISAGEKFLAGLPDGEAAPIRAELLALRDELSKRPTDDETRQLSAAKGKIRQARSQIADQQLMGVESTIETAQKHLMNVREEHREPIATDLAAVKAELAAAQEKERGPAVKAPAPAAAPPPPMASTPAPAPSAAPRAASTPAPAPAPAAPPASAPQALTDDDHANLSRARGKVNSARSLTESGRTDNVEYELAAALELLDKVPAPAAVALRAQVNEIRKLLAETLAAEAGRKAEEELSRHLSTAESDLRTGRFGSSEERLDYVAKRLGEADIQRGLPADRLASYQARVAKLRIERVAAIKADALDRARPLIDELEQESASDPFEGLDEYTLRKKAGSLSYLRARIFGALQPAPDNDPDIASIVKRAIAVDQKIESSLAAWGKAKLEASVSNDWSYIEKEIDGWEAETVSGEPAHLNEPELPKTRTAIHRTRYLLESEETKRIRAEHPGDAAVQGPFEKAERVLAEASAKLAAGYNRIFDAADKLETPMSQFVLCRPSQLAYGAESALEGTKYRDAVIARARKLDERWKAEVAAIMKARQALYDKLAAETEQSWPGMRDALNPVPFDPSNVREGMIIRLDEVYNRSGWDYGSRAYSFAVRSNGVVFGGVYAPQVLQALEHAWYELKLDVNDRIPWDLVAVVEGPGRIGVRTKVTLRDKSTGLEIGTLEEWPPIDCLRIRIIGLHAGPVAVA